VPYYPYFSFVQPAYQIAAGREHLRLLDQAVMVPSAKGFIKTGPDLTPEDLAAARWSLERSPYLLETSRPGVFAVCEVRRGNMKRVA
jgi:hypothetical protein